jgi:hypothetical protein
LSSSLTLPSRGDSETKATEPLTEDEWSDDEDEASAEEVVFDWTPPDLSEGGEWFLARVASLHEAAQTLPNPDKIIKEGLELLTIHRGN